MQQTPKRRAVFLDRDGTLNEDPGYLNDPEQVRLLPSVREALIQLRNAGFSLIVVSNQSGVGRGIISPDTLPEIHRRLDLLLGDGKIDHYEFCIHRPDEDCECRKPKPELLFRAAEKMAVDLARSYMVGDKGSDLGAGKAAGCRAAILVRTGLGIESERKLKAGEADYVANSLQAAADWILSQEIASP